MSLVNKWKSKKSQIFIFDFITSFIILIVAIVIVLSYFQSTSDNVDIYGINLEIIDSFTTTNINSLNNEEIRNLFISRQITNIENTIAQQVGEFYYRNSISNAQNLTELFIRDFISGQMNINVTMYNSTHKLILYSDTRKSIDFDDAQISSVTDRLIFGTYGGERYLYNFKIELWQ